MTDLRLYGAPARPLGEPPGELLEAWFSKDLRLYGGSRWGTPGGLPEAAGQHDDYVCPFSEDLLKETSFFGGGGKSKFFGFLLIFRSASSKHMPQKGDVVFPPPLPYLSDL